MALSDEIADDFLDFEGEPVPVTVEQIRPTGTVEATVRNATNGPLSRQQLAAMGGGLVGKLRNWSLNAVDVGSAGIEVGDKLRPASGDVWKVVQSELKTLGTRWACVCQNQE